MEKYVVVGIRKREDKNKNIWTTLFMTSEFDDYAKENSLSCLGQQTLVETTRYELPSLQIGDEVELLYAKGFEDKAVLRSVIVTQKNPVAGGNNGQAKK